MITNTPPIQETTPEMTPVEMKNTLETELEEIKNKERSLNSEEVIGTNKLKEAKEKVIQSLFGILEDNGVDASDLESINEFLSKLRDQDPDLATLFELAFTDIVGEEEQVEESPDAGLMNEFNDLSQETLMPR